jgi:hypothetical protein
MKKRAHEFLGIELKCFKPAPSRERAGQAPADLVGQLLNPRSPMKRLLATV